MTRPGSESLASIGCPPSCLRGASQNSEKDCMDEIMQQSNATALPAVAFTVVGNRREAKFTLWLICVRYRLLTYYDNIYRTGGSNHAV